MIVLDAMMALAVGVSAYLHTGSPGRAWAAIVVFCIFLRIFPYRAIIFLLLAVYMTVPTL